MEIVLALCAAAVYGVADYSGGRASRTVSPIVVTAIGQACGLIVLVVIVLASGVPTPPATDWFWGGIGGIAGASGLLAFYRAMGSGFMTVVAPVSAVTATAVPVSYTHLRAHETGRNLVCRLLLEKKTAAIPLAVAKDETQIHTHMCYAEFEDIIDAIAALDADVISIETSRSRMELLKTFEKFKYPNEVGPGVYDIHSPRVPNKNEMKELIQKASKLIDKKRIWVNPDCGLKTRGWPETITALETMVQAAKELRTEK